MISAKRLRREVIRAIGPRGQLVYDGKTVEVYRLFWSKLHAGPVTMKFKCKNQSEARLLAYMALQGLPDFVEWS
jgi:hypothetical protein